MEYYIEMQVVSWWKIQINEKEISVVYLGQTDLAVTHATLTQLTVPHLETKEEPNFVKTNCTKKVVPSEEKLYRLYSYITIKEHRTTRGGGHGGTWGQKIVQTYTYI